jgi:hypothetical protein
LLAVCKWFMASLESGAIVRDISMDDSPDWTQKTLRFVGDINLVQLAIAKAEGRV